MTRSNTLKEYSPRACLKCCRKFPSFGVNNRICDRCKSGEAFQGPPLFDSMPDLARAVNKIPSGSLAPRKLVGDHNVKGRKKKSPSLRKRTT